VTILIKGSTEIPIADVNNSPSGNGSLTQYYLNTDATPLITLSNHDVSLRIIVIDMVITSRDPTAEFEDKRDTECELQTIVGIVVLVDSRFLQRCCNDKRLNPIMF
jgi:hypothetical protein